MKSRGELWEPQWGCWALPKEGEFSNIDPLPLEGPRWGRWCGQLERRRMGHIPWECLNPLFLHSWSEGTLAHKAGCDKHRLCSQDEELTEQITSPSPQWTPWAIAAGECELNISPVEAECVVFPQLSSSPAPNRGWHCTSLWDTQPGCSCASAQLPPDATSVTTWWLVGFTILWRLRRVWNLICKANHKATTASCSDRR